MDELICILEQNNIKYCNSIYGYDTDCIVIKKNNYVITIYYDNGYVTDLHDIPFTWGEMGSTTLSDIINYLKQYLKLDLILNEQLSLFKQP